MAIGIRCLHLIAQAEIQSELLCRSPVVLDILSEEVVRLKRRIRISGRSARINDAEQHFGHAVAVSRALGYRESAAADQHIFDLIENHFDTGLQELCRNLLNDKEYDAALLCPQAAIHITVSDALCRMLVQEFLNQKDIERAEKACNQLGRDCESEKEKLNIVIAESYLIQNNPEGALRVVRLGIKSISEQERLRVAIFEMCLKQSDLNHAEEAAHSMDDAALRENSYCQLSDAFMIRGLLKEAFHVILCIRDQKQDACGIKLVKECLKAKDLKLAEQALSVLSSSHPKRYKLTKKIEAAKS